LRPPEEATASDDLATEFEKVTRLLDEGYPHVAPTASAQRIRGELPIVRALLAEGGLGRHAQGRLHRVAGRLGGMYGSALYDTGFGAETTATLRAAYEHARLGGDAPLAGWLCLQQAMVEQRAGRAWEALATARHGLRHVTTGPVAARLHAEGEAYSLGLLGDRRGVEHALERAWTLVRGFGMAERGRAGWHLDSFHPAELCSVSAAALTEVAAGDRTAADAALTYVEHGMAAVDAAGATGHRSYIRLNAAAALLVRGEIERAVLLVGTALDISADRRLTAIAATARDLVARVRALAGDPPVADLLDRLYEWRAA
jgi:hypothetical protein